MTKPPYTLNDANLLADELNMVMMSLPTFRIQSVGTRISIEHAPGHYFDHGLDCVAEFHQAFDCYVAKEPGLPPMTTESAKMLAEYQSAAAYWGERLKAMAAQANEALDEGGALLLIRLQLCQEELAELAEALIHRDIVGCLDALTDMTYVADGTYHTLGLGHYKTAATAEVHASNMSKLGEGGKPIISDAGRVVKGPNYRKPDLAAVLGIRPEVPGEDTVVAHGEPIRTNHREPGEFGDGATVINKLYEERKTNG